MPYQAHNAMEPHAAVAEWDGSRLTVHTSTQAVADTRAAIAATLQLPIEDVRVVSPFVGGGFGGKLGVQAETILAPLAARELRRPVKAAQTRQQMFHTVGHRPANLQTVKLAATHDGRLTGISHDAVLRSSPFDEFPEQIAVSTRALYAAPNRSTRHRLVRLDMQSGDAAVQTDMTDIGTGTYTILTQIAADELGLPPGRIVVQLADSRFPRSPGSGGSWGAASAGSAVKDACGKLRSIILERVRTVPGSPVARAKDGAGAKDGAAAIRDGMVTIGGQSAGIEAVAAAVAGNRLEALGQVAGMPDNPAYRDFSQHGFGAHFAEVGVDADTGEIRVRRMLGAFAAGKILNPKTARSQVIGGMIWGMSSALHENAVIDARFGQFVNHDLTEYHVPVHADVPDVDAFFVPEDDDKGNVLGIKGIGELGICGSGAAVGNAVFNATGTRVRQFPITLDQMLLELPKFDT